MDRTSNSTDVLDQLADPDWGIDALWGLVLELNSTVQELRDLLLDSIAPPAA